MPHGIDPEVDVPASLVGREVAPVVVEETSHLSGAVTPGQAVQRSTGVVPKKSVAQSGRPHSRMLPGHHGPVVGHHAVIDSRDQGDFRVASHNREGPKGFGRRNRRADEAPIGTVGCRSGRPSRQDGAFSRPRRFAAPLTHRARSGRAAIRRLMRRARRQADGGAPTRPPGAQRPPQQHQDAAGGSIHVSSVEVGARLRTVGGRLSRRWSGAELLVQVGFGARRRAVTARFLAEARPTEATPPGRGGAPRVPHPHD